MSKKVYGLIFLVLITLVFLVGCGRAPEGQNEEQEGAYIQIKGSDTSVNLSQMWAEEYMSKNEEVSISVTGGGSGTGIAAIINNKVDIANSSRDIKDSEKKQAEDNGIKIVEIAVAMDGLSVITNANNPVKDLTVEEIGKIFRGEITNWKEVGGPNLAINTYGRQSNSGTYVYFRDEVLNGDYTANMKRMNGNAQLVEAVKADESGIGYVGIGYVVKGEKVVKGINILDVNGASPLKAENVKTGAYPLARPLYQYTNGKPTGAVLELIKYELSDEGQELAVREGFYPVTEEYSRRNNENLGQ
ncbi:phosphate-binding protein [Orenia metallireducens]|uniref:Phosphate-binding protein n=1 Tax=Orenia metallireducens TaxID=1413210 RepID=A0A1C0AAI3_9FIRM|nr:PstS family phosphate ABC transporter substrate-binding protein [Orenia metallireducens]OCL27300.1 phosphate-binding protein [Orenia metallireducens]